MRSIVKGNAPVWAIVAVSVGIFAFVAAHSSKADESSPAPADSPAADGPARFRLERRFQTTPLHACLSGLASTGDGYWHWPRAIP